MTKIIRRHRPRISRAASSSSAPPPRAAASRSASACRSASAPPHAQRRRAGAEVNAWVVIKPDDTCVIRIARSEMGQGTLTGLAQLVAEELECDWNKVGDEFPTPGESLARKRVWGEMGTGGSRGIRTSEDYVRRGGAAARMMLLQAAADEWKVPVERAHGRQRRHHAHADRSARRRYGKVAAAAAKLTPPDPKSITLKDPQDWKIAGKPMKRLDTAPKLNGSLVYAIDVKLPGMLCAAIKALPGVRRQARELRQREDRRRCPACKRAVKVNDTTVAVVADTWWHAKTALDALPIVWDEGTERDAVRARTIAEHLKEGPDGAERLRDDATKATRRRRSPARRRRSRPSTARRSSRTRRWSR